jgi:membrane protein required for colicin V production
MQIYDVLMLIVLAGALLFGVWKGMAWQVASLASVVVSGAVAVHSSPAIAPWFGSQEPWNRFCAMAVLYVITAGAIWILFRLVSNIIDRVKLKEFDRQLGATFGLAKGVLYCVVITFFAVTLSESSRQVVLASRSGDLIARGIRNANPILPADVRKYLGEYIDELDKGLHAPPQNPAPQSAAPQTDGANPSPQPPAPPTEGQKESPKPAAPASPAEGRGPAAKLKKMLLGR